MNTPPAELSAKFGVYLSNVYDGRYTLNRRCICINFRKQLRGLGGTGLGILRKNQISEIIDSEITPGMFVKIVDITENAPETWSDVNELFSGYITTVTEDKVEGVNDGKGFANVNEIGHYYTQLPIVWKTTPTIFNPVVGGTAYGNKKVTEDTTILEFETILSNMATQKQDGSSDSNIWSDLEVIDGKISGNIKTWTLENYLLYMANLCNVEVRFPWDFDADIIRKRASDEISKINPNTQSGKDAIAKKQGDRDEEIKKIKQEYFAFREGKYVISYNHYNGESFMKLLSEVIVEPFDWFISSKSTSMPTFQVINKSPIAVTDWCPAGQLAQKQIDKVPTTIFNVTRSSEVFDKLIYRGNNILIAGTLSCWNNNNSASMVQDWTIPEEIDFIKASATPEDPNSVGQKNESVVNIIRNNNKNVYRKWKYKYYDQECAVRIAKRITLIDGKTGKYWQAPYLPRLDGTDEYNMVPFFPKIDFSKIVDLKEVPLDVPIVYDELNLHMSPTLLDMTWADKLPWIDAKTKNRRDPFITATTYALDGSLTNPTYFTFDMMNTISGMDTCEFKHTVNGFDVIFTIRETLAYSDQFLFRCNGVDVDATTQFWKADSVSKRNPTNDPKSGSKTYYQYFTNYKLIAPTVAGYSSQRLERIIANPNPTGNRNIKIVENKNLNCHFAHAGTIKNAGDFTQSGDTCHKFTGRTYMTGLERFDNDTFIVNDYPSLYKLADQTANWLFLPKNSIKLELALMKYNSNAWNIGELVSKINDNTVLHTVNTCVASIEYDCAANRVYVSTDIPEMPMWKQAQQIPQSTSLVAPTSDITTSKIEVKDKTNNKEMPKLGTIINAAAAPPQQEKEEIWLRVVTGQGAGNSLTSGQYGVKKIITQLANQTAWKDVYATATLPDGLGRASIWIDGEQQVTADAPLYAAGATYSINQQVSYNDTGYKCSVAGVSTTFNAGTAKFVIDSSILEKPKQVFVLLDSRAQFSYAIAENEWIRVFSLIKFGNATNPASGVAEDQKAYTGAFF